MRVTSIHITADGKCTTSTPDDKTLDGTLAANAGVVCEILANLSRLASIASSSGQNNLWTDYRNPKPDFEDVETDRKTFASGIAPMFLNEDCKVNFVHGADLTFPLMGMVEKILQKGESVTSITQLKFSKIVQKDVMIHVWDAACEPSINSEKNDTNVSGSVVTSTGRIIRFGVTETKSKITEARSGNMFALHLLEGGKLEVVDENKYRCYLNPKLSDSFSRDFGVSASARISTLVEIVTILTLYIYRMNLGEDTEKKRKKNYLYKISELPTFINLIEAAKNGDYIEILVNPKKQKTSQTGATIMTHDFLFPGCTESTKVYSAHQ